jgi:hypothetical protein
MKMPSTKNPKTERAGKIRFSTSTFIPGLWISSKAAAGPCRDLK